MHLYKKDITASCDLAWYDCIRPGCLRSSCLHAQPYFFRGGVFKPLAILFMISICLIPLVGLSSESWPSASACHTITGRWLIFWIVISDRVPLMFREAVKSFIMASRLRGGGLICHYLLEALLTLARLLFCVQKQKLGVRHRADQG